ncbi:hypothetical protein [Rhizobium bangladeshense]|uniref:hypothetical protein n=1 Tax=Rhizobium bangladeshense TaxID=1138189 RepID=UPI0007E5458D|nr:hypothetical protein [Rhizobium bangladeshense]
MAPRFNAAASASDVCESECLWLHRQLSVLLMLFQVIIDNAHKLEAAALRSLIDAAPELRFLCLAQPWDGASEIEATYSMEAERLGGWSTDEIAAEFKDGGIPTSIENAIRVRGLTGGLPLYVQNAAAIAAHEFAADVLAFCDAIEKRTNDRETAQEIILRAMFESMDDVKVNAYLSFLELPITRDELFAMLGESGLKDQSIASSLTKLRRSSSHRVSGEPYRAP